MEFFSSLSKVFVFLFLFFTYVNLLFLFTEAATVVVDGVSEWKDPTVQIGDSVIFEHKNHYKLYIFQNRRAFTQCNFTQATLLNKPNSTSYTWHPSRLGYFYFSFNNGSTKPCQEGQKLAIKVSFSLAQTSPPQPPTAAPPLSSGGAVSSSPAYPWPFRPQDPSTPTPAPVGSILPAISPSMGPDNKGDDGIPFISSNPAVPLPTGEVDSATIGPLPISDGLRLQVGVQVMGSHQVQGALCFMLFLVLL